ncbi:MAG TPA: hypothetical protein VM052_02105 [Candidatus Limnocylindrales bacterium]|nr:hypothetical protein [Candidatus Limnocylindrales bacterium]
MAGALRPVIVLMLLASLLFIAAGVLDGVYPGGAGWSLTDAAAISYLFAVVNTIVAFLVARGSERSLALRMGLSLFFVIERPVSAFLIGSKSAPSIGIHLATALVELIILVSAMGVWRLGHSVGSGDMDEAFSLDPASAPPARAGDRDDSFRSQSGALPVRTAWVIGLCTLLLAAVLVADGVASDFLPGGREWGLSGESSGWLVYLFAVVVLTVATRAVKGGHLALRLLAITALIFFIERAFSPFALRVVDPLILGLHGLAAFVALAVALSAASAIRGSRGRNDRDVASLEAA